MFICTVLSLFWNDVLIPSCIFFYYCFFKPRLALISYALIFRVPLHWIGFGYAALVASGGIIGYAKAGMICSRLNLLRFSHCCW